MLKYLTQILLATCLVSCNASQQITIKEHVSEPLTIEEIAINKVVGDVYSSFKVENGNLPDFTHIKSLFTPDARLGYVKDDTLKMYSVDEYVSNMKTGLTKNKISLLKEWEIKGKTEYFGDIGHRISSYGVYVNTTDQVAERGIISYQLVKINGKWLVLSMIWDSENSELKLPARFDL